MKSAITFFLNRILVLSFIFGVMPSVTWGMGQASVRPKEVSFNYEAFHGQFAPVPPCKMEAITLEAHPDQLSISLKLSNGREHIPFTQINQKPRSFNTCFTDGQMETVETEGDGTTLVETTIFQQSNYLCNEAGDESSRSERTLTLDGDHLSLKLVTTSSSSGSLFHPALPTVISSSECAFIRTK